MCVYGMCMLGGSAGGGGWHDIPTHPHPTEPIVFPISVTVHHPILNQSPPLQSHPPTPHHSTPPHAPRQRPAGGSGGRTGCAAGRSIRPVSPPGRCPPAGRGRRLTGGRRGGGGRFVGWVSISQYGGAVQCSAVQQAWRVEEGRWSDSIDWLVGLSLIDSSVQISQPAIRGSDKSTHRPALGASNSNRCPPVRGRAPPAPAGPAPAATKAPRGAGGRPSLVVYM